MKPKTDRVMSDWIKCSDELPPDGVVVQTKIDDTDGIRNEQNLVRHHRMWFLPSCDVYIYYNPTHWRFDATDET